MAQEKYYKYNGDVFKVKESPKEGKDLRAVFPDGKKVDFGAKDYKEFPATKKGDQYCARSKGIGEKYDNLGNIKSANTLSRKILWNCKGDQSTKSKKKAGIKLAEKEEFFEKQ